ncbi:eCIS core domain-containing protein [Actinomadura fibrosa]|uniref:DUF4157 domain-containing protein n=1 Tax=Actinomadura fibrosa TaxID=111802 RepID=A0ABW2XZT0_9ACTN|nr:DUF4157 domain-containing protein [Actinomadura fibrosa]
MRARLEDALNADLGALRVHRNEDSDRLCELYGTDALASGADIFLRHDAPAADTAPGLWLLTHEAAHTVQQSTGLREGGLAQAIAERSADAAAATVLAGTSRAVGNRVVVRRPGPGDPVMVQCHASWEHRLLGDAATGDLDAIARGAPERLDILKKLRDYLKLWVDGPDGITTDVIHKYYPYIQTFPLPTDNGTLLATYGELNTLPDYMANPAVQEAQPEALLLKILQAVRQEGYNRVDGLLGGKHPLDFKDAVAINTGWSFIDLLTETYQLNDLTWDIGPEHTNHYTALVARNACHFAPFSWYRWRQAYDRAVELARLSHAARDEKQKMYYAYQAWIHHGYADHFLQDSFAAGHLINKNLVMQWFVEWAENQPLIPVYDWPRVRNMVTAEQPGLAARALYNRKDPGTVRDPQTAEEQPEQWDRMQVSGVRETKTLTQGEAYQCYLAFLNSTVVQSASGVLHDHFNAASLRVASLADSTAYQIWGDDTMLNGGDGVRIASETAHMSQRSLRDYILTGDSAVSPEDIAQHFPAWVEDKGSLVGLEEWNDRQRNLAVSLFPSVHYYLLRLYPEVKYVSVDWNKPYQPGWRPWSEAGRTPAPAIQPGAAITALWRARRERLDLFTTAPSGAVLTCSWDEESDWTPWETVGTTTVFPGATVSAVWRGDRGDHLDLFATAENGAVLSTYWEPGIGWQPWFTVQDFTKAFPGATVTAVWREGGDTHLDLFTTAIDGAVASTYWDIESGWTPWFVVNNGLVTPGAPITALWRRPEHLDLFASVYDGSVLSTYWEPGVGWQPWFVVGKQPGVAVPGAAVAGVWRTDEQLDLLTVGKDATRPNGTVRSATWQAGTGWQPWYAVQPDTGRAYLGRNATVTAVRSGGNDFTDAFVLSPDGIVQATYRGTKTDWVPWYGIHPETKMHPGAAITALWRDADRLDLFVSAPDGTVLTTRWAPPMPSGTGHLGIPL